jgi:hypothetical protein
MSIDRAKLIVGETLVSAAINAAISVAFFVAVFGSRDPVPAWGVGHYAFDFAPQSFAIGLMASLVPGLLARKAMTAGRAGSSHAVPTKGAVVTAALFNGLLAMVAGTAICGLILYLSGAETVQRTPAFAAKVAYGAVLGALVTRRMLKRMLAKGDNVR